MRRRALFVCLLACAGVACSVDPRPSPSPSASLSNVAEPPIAPAPVTLESTPPPAPPPDMSSLRDPFTPSTPPVIVPVPSRPDQMPRKARRYSLDQLKLVGIVSDEGESSRAMFVDPRGKGWIVGRGDRVGRAETVADHHAGWRVDRIRREEIVFVRDDADVTGQVETRIIALRSAAPSSVLDEMTDADD